MIDATTIINRLQINDKEFEIGYLTGAIFGDGCLNENGYRIDIYNTNKEYLGILYTILNRLLPTNSIHISIKNNSWSKKNCFVISINSKDIYMLLKPYKKCYHYKIPDWIKTKNQKAGLISGLFDTDGSVSYIPLQMTLTSKYIKNLYQISSLLKEFYINSSVKPIANTTALARLYISGYENKKQFKEKISFHHPRKSEILKKVLDEKYQIYKRKQKFLLKVEELYKQGKSISTIRDTLKLPNSTVIHWLDETYPNRKKRIQNKYSTKQYFEVIKLKKRGLGRYKISKKLNIPPTTIFYWLHGGKPHSVRRTIYG